MEQSTKQKRNQRISWLINLAGVLAFGFILYLGGVEAWQQIIHGDWRFVLAAAAVTLLWNLVAAWRWSIIANHLVNLPQGVPFRYYFTYHMLGMFIGQVVPITVGMLGGRPVALSLSRGASLKRAGLSVFVDKLFDLLLALLLALPIALFLVKWIGLALALSLMGAAALGALVFIRLEFERGIVLVGKIGERLSKPLARLPIFGPRLVRRIPDQFHRLTTTTLLPNRLAARTYLLTLAMYFLLWARLYLISQALNLNIPAYLLAMGISITQLALIFSVTPGSLGFLEGGWAAVLGLGGLSVDQFSIFVIGRRAYVLVFTLINTLLAFGWIRESPARLFREVLSASRKGEIETTEIIIDPNLTHPSSLEGPLGNGE
jgi:uncharacterized protein (TIRG00374 family)